MPKLFAAREVLAALLRYGFVLVSQEGSHIKLRGNRNNELRTVIVPNHKELALGTFRSILRQAGMTKKEFEEYL